MRACPFFMSAIKDGGLFPIMLDKERHLLFSLHVIDEVEDKIGDISDLKEKMENKGRMKFITWLLTLLINEGEAYKTFQATGQIDGAEVLTERIVAMLIHSANMANIMQTILAAFTLSSRGTTDPPDDGEEDDESGGEDNGIEGNAQAGGGE